MSKALIIFIKNAEEGMVKTRLASTVGNEKALSIYKMLLYHTNIVAQGVNADRFVYYGSFIDTDDEWRNEHYVKKLQHGDDLGMRMCHAFKDIFTEGFENICIIGSDCPELTTNLIEQSFVQLQYTDIVIGPAKDGGYYLLGSKKFHPGLFENISWSSLRVMEQTLAICRRLKLSFYLLPELSDIDDENDLDKVKGFIITKV